MQVQVVAVSLSRQFINHTVLTRVLPMEWAFAGEIVIGSLTVLAAAGLLLYPAAVPTLRELNLVVFDSPLLESVVLPIVFYQCLEKIALSSPAIGALTPIIVVLMYLVYLWAWRAFLKYMEQQPSPADETGDEADAEISTSSEEQEESDEITEEKLPAVEEAVEEKLEEVMAAEYIATAQTVENMVAVELPQVQCDEDVFTVLQKSAIELASTD